MLPLTPLQAVLSVLLLVVALLVLMWRKRHQLAVVLTAHGSTFYIHVMRNKVTSPVEETVNEQYATARANQLASLMKCQLIDKAHSHPKYRVTPVCRDYTPIMGGACSRF